MTSNYNGKHDPVSIDKLKPAYVELDLTTVHVFLLSYLVSEHLQSLTCNQHQYQQLFLKCQQPRRCGLAIKSIGQLILYSFLELETLGLFIVLYYNFYSFLIKCFLFMLTNFGY